MFLYKKKYQKNNIKNCLILIFFVAVLKLTRAFFIFANFLIMEGLENSETSGILQLIVCQSNIAPFPVHSHCFSSLLLRWDFSTQKFFPCLFLFQGTTQQFSELTSNTVRVTFLFEDCPGTCSFLNSDLVPDVRAGNELLGNQALLNISNLQNTTGKKKKSNIC